MAITINGTGSITGLTAGGLPDGSITADDIASGAVTTSKLSGGPAFGAVSTTSTTLSANVETKIILDNETFDTGGCFDSTVNYRFTPNVAGYYQVNANVCVGGAGGAYTICSIYRNGVLYTRSNTLRTSNGNYNTANTSNIIYFNGSTDYVELYGLDPSNNVTITGTIGSYFSAALIRPA